jgi:hypothetical protein
VQITVIVLMAIALIPSVRGETLRTSAATPPTTTAPAPDPTSGAAAIAGELAVPGDGSAVYQPPSGAAAPNTADRLPGEEASADTLELRLDDAADTASSTATRHLPVPPPAGATRLPVPNDVSRDIPTTAVASEPPAPGPWDAATVTTGDGQVQVPIGCATGTSAAALDAFFRERLGPVMGEDYQHVYALGGSRYLWLFQDAFIDMSGVAADMSKATFVHNIALVQEGACFTLLYRGSPQAPAAFEPGIGGRPIATWFWPMGGELVGGALQVFWAQMERDGYDPTGADGLGWHPVRTWLATYDPVSLVRTSLAPAADDGVRPIYGYSVVTQGDTTYLFGNSFEQNLLREGGFANGPHSATAMYLARVPAGQLAAAPEYRTADGWSSDPAAAVPIVQRYWAENPMQPRRFGDEWVSVTKVDGYWGDELAVDVANEPWGPWTTVDQRTLLPRNGDPLMNTYHAHLMPWLADGQLVVSISQNARNMRRDAYPAPGRYRPGFFAVRLVRAPPDPTTTTSTTLESTTSSDATTTEPTSTDVSTTTTSPASTTTTTTSPTTTTTTTSSTSTTTTSTTTTAPATTAPSPTTEPATTTGPATSPPPG